MWRTLVLGTWKICAVWFLPNTCGGKSPTSAACPSSTPDVDMGYRQQQGRSLSREAAAVKKNLGRVNDYLQRFYVRVNVYLAVTDFCLIAVSRLKTWCEEREALGGPAKLAEVQIRAF